MSFAARADWLAPAHVHTLTTTRNGGTSAPPWASFNLGDHVGDDAGAVAANRARLAEHLPAEPVWLNQIHSAAAIELDGTVEPGVPGAAPPPAADASVTRVSGVVCAVLTADCLPVLLCDRAGTVVAAAHAGWRGLAGGVLEATVELMRSQPDEIVAWLGPAIGPQAFEVGSEVREAFIARHPQAATAFRRSPGDRSQTGDDKWFADLYALARIRLAAVGVTAVSGGGRCTHTEAETFFSFRRDGQTGRMAHMIWLAG